MKVQFSTNCLYKIYDADDKDINKLFGWSMGLHHKNSIRIGWRTFPHDWNMIELFAYWYEKGIRGQASIGYVKPGENYFIRVLLQSDHFVITVDDKNMNSHISPQQFDIGSLPRWGYRLYPYFGGNKKAPHRMTLTMERIKI